MPLVLCPNCQEGMKEVERHGVRVDICPSCRGVWLDRGELEKLLAAAREAAAEDEASIPVSPPQAPHPPQPSWPPTPPPGWPQQGWPQPAAGGHPPYERKKKRRFFDDLFDIFD
ncbi:hypothetical protein HRbin40_01212 [bacterium HR40]|nr:hypothetical protein HRbin40_01212 [bacterium HR40]